MPRLCYVLDLHDDAALIAEYERWHQPTEVWPEVVASLQQAGILELEIFRSGDRLVMLMDVSEHYDPAAKAARDAADPRIQAWEALMWRFQSRCRAVRPGKNGGMQGRFLR